MKKTNLLKNYFLGLLVIISAVTLAASILKMPWWLSLIALCIAAPFLIEKLFRK